MARFIQRDSIFGDEASPASLNRYAYGRNNPLAFQDPTGHWISPFAGILDPWWNDPYFAGAGCPAMMCLSPEQAWYGSGGELSAGAGLGGAVFLAGSPMGSGGLLGNLFGRLFGRAPYNWGRPPTLFEHYQRHGPGVGAANELEYASLAQEFLVQSQRMGLPTLVNSSGIVRIYDPSRNWFAAYNPDLTTRTFFAPSSPTYWERNAPNWGSPPWLP